MRRLETRELFLMLWRRGYTIAQLANLLNDGIEPWDGCGEANCASFLEEWIRADRNEAAQHKKRGRR